MEGFYLFGEDLVGWLVGPFPDRAAAVAHLEFWKERGDAAAFNSGTARIVEGPEAERMLHPGPVSYQCTPEEDRNFQLPPLPPESPRSTRRISLDGKGPNADALIGTAEIDRRGGRSWGVTVTARPDGAPNFARWSCPDVFTEEQAAQTLADSLNEGGAT